MKFSLLKKTLIFLFCFNLDIQFVSANLNAKESQRNIQLLELPESCRSNRKPCVLQLKKGKNFKWDLKDFSISFNEGGIVSFNKANKIQLIKGNFLIETKKKLNILTRFGSIRMTQGLGLLNVQDEQITATNLTDENFSIKHIGENQLIFLPKAYQIWISGFKNTLKKLFPIFGVPRPASFNQLLNDWSDLITKPDAKFFKQLRAFRNSWNIALEETSLWHKEIIKARSLSSTSSSNLVSSNKIQSMNKKIQSPNKKAHKNCSLIKLFMKKNYLDLSNVSLPDRCKTK